MDKKAKITLVALVLIAIVAAIIAVRPTVAAKPVCNDGIDNDGDSLTDYPNDPGCASKTDNDEGNCGNGAIDGTEVCDGTLLNGQTCLTQGFSDGTLQCNSACTGYVTSNCYTNSCADTDGGLVFNVTGTVSGNAGGFPYSYSDFCPNMQVLFEFYCNGNSYATMNVSCANGCLNGACQ